MKKLIIIIGLIISINVMADVPLEAGWKSSLRSIISKILGDSWSDRLLGLPPAPPEAELQMPKIPNQFSKSTDIGSYTKLTKETTEYDQLPIEKKRQYDYSFIEELFQVTRKMDAKDEDLSNWLNTLDQGGSREGIYQALVLDEVYSGLESLEEKPTEKLLTFYLNFSQKYLNQTFQVDSLKPLNLYSLKRILTEKNLDLMEYYEVTDLDSLYRWYAILSADLAKDYGSFMKTAIRQDPSAQYHYEWAKGVPIQFIKSEIIIKVHGIMNRLQLLE